MKASICEVCLKNDMLCEGCSNKLENGEISEEAVEISRYLYSLIEEYPYLKDAEIEKIYSSENVIVIVAAKEDVGKVVGKGGEIVKLLAKKWERAIRVVEMSEDVKKFSKNLLPDVNIYGVNRVFSPDEDYYKVVVSEDDRNRVMLTEDEFTELVEEITRERARLSFTS